MHLRSPFLELEDERAARERIDAFFLETVIPLAAKTNAVVVCEAVKQVLFLVFLSAVFSTLTDHGRRLAYFRQAFAGV